MGVLFYCLAGLIVACVYVMLRGPDVSYVKTIGCYIGWPLVIAYCLMRLVKVLKGAEKREFG